jgi:hypothetical protein
VTEAEQKLVDAALVYDLKRSSTAEQLMEDAIVLVKAERCALASQKLIEGLMFLYHGSPRQLDPAVMALIKAYRQNVGLV